MIAKQSDTRTRLGQAFAETASFVHREIEAESYEVAYADVLTPERVQAIRRKVAASAEEFERQLRISARTMGASEHGRPRPDAAMQTLLRVIDREPDAVRLALGS